MARPARRASASNMSGVVHLARWSTGRWPLRTSAAAVTMEAAWRRGSGSCSCPAVGRSVALGAARVLFRLLCFRRLVGAWKCRRSHCACSASDLGARVTVLPAGVRAAGLGARGRGPDGSGRLGAGRVGCAGCVGRVGAEPFPTGRGSGLVGAGVAVAADVMSGVTAGAAVMVVSCPRRGWGGPGRVRREAAARLPGVEARDLSRWARCSSRRPGARSGRSAHRWRRVRVRPR